MQDSYTWRRYKGDGSTPGTPPQTRGEHGRYLADPELVTAVNTALAVEQPLLVTGEPGTGKTVLAWSVASELGLGDVLEFHTRSDHQARDVLFMVDNMRRFYDAQIEDPRAKAFENYVEFQALGRAIRSREPRVVLIDEIDKAPRDFPNDLLNVMDRMEFTVPELGDTPFTTPHRPVVIITSNSERQLPDPFMRRCVFHRIEFPAPDRLIQIVGERLGHLKLSERLVGVAVKRFDELRHLPDLQKKPALGELLAWVRVLEKSGIDPGTIAGARWNELPFRGALVKNDADVRVLAQA